VVDTAGGTTEGGQAMTSPRRELNFTVRNDSIEHYLADMSKQKLWWAYNFVAKHGRRFGKCRPLPDGCVQGQPKACFWNAYLLSSLRTELIYVEGFARRAIGTADFITHHAWTVDEKGHVYDPTWKGIEYFGVPFKPEYSQRTMKRMIPKCFSLLDNSVEKFPLRRSKSLKMWLQPMTFGKEQRL
jgi:hypothetical protein